jgi:tripartite-type tricarboxylate transporter receptor subunit TctC
MAPLATPKEVVSKLNAEIVRAAKAPEYVKKMNEQGYIVLATSPEQMGEMSRAEYARWGPIVKASGAKAE